MIKHQVCTRVEHAPLTDVVSLEDTAINFKTGKSFQYLLMHKAEISEETTKTDQGNLTTQQFVLIAEVSKEKDEMLQNPQIFRLTLENGNQIVLGINGILLDLNKRTANLGRNTYQYSREINFTQI